MVLAVARSVVVRPRYVMRRSDGAGGGRRSGSPAAPDIDHSPGGWRRPGCRMTAGGGGSGFDGRGGFAGGAGVRVGGGGGGGAGSGCQSGRRAADSSGASTTAGGPSRSRSSCRPGDVPRAKAVPAPSSPNRPTVHHRRDRGAAARCSIDRRSAVLQPGRKRRGRSRPQQGSVLLAPAVADAHGRRRARVPASAQRAHNVALPPQRHQRVLAPQPLELGARPLEAQAWPSRARSPAPPPPPRGAALPARKARTPPRCFAFIRPSTAAHLAPGFGPLERDVGVPARCRCCRARGHKAPAAPAAARAAAPPGAPRSRRSGKARWRSAPRRETRPSAPGRPGRRSPGRRQAASRSGTPSRSTSRCTPGQVPLVKPAPRLRDRPPGSALNLHFRLDEAGSSGVDMDLRTTGIDH